MNIEYKVVKSEKSGELTHSVNGFIKEGWIVSCNIAQRGSIYYQALHKPSIVSETQNIVPFKKVSNS